MLLRDYLTVEHRVLAGTSPWEELETSAYRVPMGKSSRDGTVLTEKRPRDQL